MSRAPKDAAGLIAAAGASDGRALARAKVELKSMRDEVKRLEKVLAHERARSEVISDLRTGARAPRAIRTSTKNLHKRVATPVLLCSDWHVGERVVADKVNGVNAYDQHEATRRAEKLGDALCWQIVHHRNSFEIREAVLALLGDLITGYLHPDQQQSNTLPPNAEVLLVQDLVGGIIDKVLGLPGIERLVIPCCFGNHGRTTPKPQIATGAENSFEWLLYHQLRRNYAADSRVEFSISNGEFLRLQVHRTTLGFHHGDSIKSQGGVGGILVPIFRAIPRWDSYGYADLWNIGHFHQYHQTPRVATNGSLIGAGPYSLRVGAFERPAQAYYMVDSKRGPCQSTPIWVTSSREKDGVRRKGR